MKRIKYLIIDVDGTMTDSGIYYDEVGNEIKRFSTRDGEAIKLAHSVGIKIIVVTGRCCEATDRRMKELKIDFFEQGIINKYEYLNDFLSSHTICEHEVGYIGDDINDYAAMSLAGFVGCPADACVEVKQVANYISDVKGGYGAVRDIIDYMLRQRGEWNNAFSSLYGECIRN